MGADFVCCAVLEKATLRWTLLTEGGSNDLEYALDILPTAYSELLGLYACSTHIATVFTLPCVYL